MYFIIIFVIIMKQRIYIDTSVIGGYFDDEFKESTGRFFERIFDRDFSVYFSSINDAELTLAPQHIRELKDRIPADCYRYVELNQESKDLAGAYIMEKALGQASYNDAYHIAIASVNRLDVLVSWNFKHIVNYDKIKLFNSINLKLGYPLIDIRTPLELIKYGDQD